MVKGHNNNSGGKMMIMNRGMRSSYGFMLLLGFGAAVFGVMVLHKLRERRIFDLLIKEKDQQLFSLQLLLQKERDYAKETRRKTEEMRAKIYSLRTQKMNLDNRILEMRSTISSMRDEQRTIEMTLEEKQNEIKQLNKRKIDYTKVTPLAIIEGMEQQHIGQPVKVWSVSADDPSNPQVNSTEAGESKETGAKSVNYIDGSGNESANNSNGEKSRQGKDRIENEGEVAVRRAMTGEQPRKQERTSEESMERGSTTSETSIDHYQGENIENSQVGGGSGIGNEENNSIGARVNKSAVEVGKSRDADSEIDSHLEVPASSVRSENDKSEAKYRGGIKLQTADNHTLRHTNKRKGRGKKLRNIANNRMFKNMGKLEEIGVARIKGRGFFEGALEIERNKAQQDAEPRRNELKGIDEQVGLDHKEEKSALDGENAKEKQMDVKTTDVSTEVKLLKPEVSTVARNISNGGNRKSDQPFEDMQETRANYITAEKHHISSDEQQLTRTVDGGEGNGTVDGEGNRTTTDASKHNQVEDGRSDEEAGDKHKEIEQRDSVEVDKDSQQGKAEEKDEEPEDLEAEDLHESDTDISRESSSTLEEDKEEYKEEADEPDF